MGSILEAEKETNSLSSKIVCCKEHVKHNGFKMEYKIKKEKKGFLSY
jgi:hypothetical protein